MTFLKCLGDTRGLIGAAFFVGFGLSDIMAWHDMMRDAPHSPSIPALSTFGPGMLAMGIVLLVVGLTKRPT
jgi:hypothetical protein